MYFNIAKNNIKKSFKDYTIYFLTLSFAVCVFYAFNSIGSQSAMTTLNESQKEYMELMNNVTNILSIFVSIILGALIIYANNFLIKRRKKELGIYMTLGMGKGKISRILVLETLIVGAISLIVGLIVGLIISQGLSVLTAKLFGGIISKMGFIISYSAIGKTILYFGIIFVLVMIFNTVIISKYKLIDLLTAVKKNEKIKIKNPVLLFIIFIIGAVILASGYVIILKDGLTKMAILWVAIGLGTIGTFLFFYGLAGFMVIVSQNNKNRYLRGLNIFVTKQMNNKINTSFVSMALISLMLFVTISALSTGVSLKNAMSESIKNNTPFDVSTTVYTDENSTVTLTQAIDELNKIYPNYSTEFKSAVFTSYRYNTPVSIKSKAGMNTQKYTNYMTIDDYNNYLKLLGKAPITLNENSVLLVGAKSKTNKGINKILASKAKLEFNDKEYDIQNLELINDSLENSPVASSVITIIYPENFVSSNFKWSGKSIIVNANADNKFNSKKVQESLSQKAHKYEKEYNSTSNNANSPIYFVSTRGSIIADSQGISTIILYIAIYIGVIFLLTSSAVIALQQLVEASDSKERYDVLRKIGATNSMINKAILKQVVIAFMLPLILAIVDSIVAIKVVSSFVETFGKSGIVGASLMTGGVIIVIYGGYMMATYFGFKNTVRENK
ncbi:ABC transporter permease [uncultured Clostridium sp.]|jgi:putative ABC transport system permease protein|uniref:ABC transporter permease n=1 Tax=uncultured Clostridium sp. TaxID=59620 RepID=UPI00260AF8B8|nr:ABC transporter permease [uncultured Clostridium sp.]